MFFISFILSHIFFFLNYFLHVQFQRSILQIDFVRHLLPCLQLEACFSLSFEEKVTSTDSDAVGWWSEWGVIMVTDVIWH